MKISKKEFVDWVYLMNLQNLSGRETFDEAFKLGVEAAFEEFMERESLLNNYGTLNCKCLSPIPLDDRTGGKTCRICMKKVTT